ncbi:hypothetical protein ILUMI_17770 [Ignelater luminosus]|uniref:Uncharacterized protein n=1 Tax=Ignelater luminosus TaxID=2038154 RepID=A0A8K0G7L0_IGNLU|nr:hypothetical protein ILUMI_17770 [Ignelater luminosus]
MELIVDKPKPGYGPTNDGNTALRVLSSGKTVDGEYKHRTYERILRTSDPLISSQRKTTPNKLNGDILDIQNYLVDTEPLISLNQLDIPHDLHFSDSKLDDSSDSDGNDN